MKVGLVVPVLNNFEQAIDMLYSAKTKHELKIYIQPQYRVQVPLSAAWNNGSLQAIADGCEYVLITNDDILFAPSCIDHMVEAFSLLPKEVVMVSANNVAGQLASPFEVLNWPEETADKPLNASDHPNYACFMVQKDFFIKCGTFDERFDPAWYEDGDSHYRIQLLGYRAICTTYATCVHYGGVTTSKLGAPPDSSRSRDYYVKKWGSARRHEGPEEWKHPYNDPSMSPRDWDMRPL